MNSIGIYELKTHASEVMDRVEKGEIIRVTRNGKPVGRIIPDDSEEELDAEKFMEEIRELRKELSLPRDTHSK